MTPGLSLRHVSRHTGGVTGCNLHRSREGVVVTYRARVKALGLSNLLPHQGFGTAPIAIEGAL